MIQSIDKQLQVVMRALREVVAPALAGAEKHVAEQVHLSIATLAFVAERLPEARRYYRWELSACLDLARELGHEGDAALGAFVEAGTAVLARPEADIADYEKVTHQGREAIAAFAEADGSVEVERLILKHSAAIIDQQRQWCRPFGFELKPETLPAPAW
ncbi:hypothetical protein [Sphingomonas profundi]|uniref:hypothetical protein n=1 Tax=Alterirhizorhabdus profundi TaxID=2681549 RepID=UPI0012E7B59F|nr:hypothetical protein [Sphingomonas profundi]